MEVVVRKDLSADALFALLGARFDQLPDVREGKVVISLGDTLRSAFAMFSLKDPSLLAFDQRKLDENDNFRTIYGIEKVPCDSQMRTILDEVDPVLLRPLFVDVFRCLQRGKELEQFAYLDGHYLISLDGTEHHSSRKIHCSSCLEKNHRGGGVTYTHQVLGATLVHPDLKVVIPLAPEPIINEDGHLKNDCERNATRRWLKQFRQDHPRLPIIIVEDALSANAPHIADLQEANARFIIGVKRGDHAFLFQHLEANDEAGRTQTLTLVDEATGVLHHFRFHNQVPLNGSHQDCLVNVLEYWEVHPEKMVKGVRTAGQVQYFSWITDIVLAEDNVYSIMRGGRARWKIENETFNTLKNQGYNLEHNYGHGQKYLSVVLMLLMFLAFLVDQVQQLSCRAFQAAWQKLGTKRNLWETMRSYFQTLVFASMTELLQAIIHGIQRQPPVLNDST